MRQRGWTRVHRRHRGGLRPDSDAVLGTALLGSGLVGACFGVGFAVARRRRAGIAPFAVWGFLAGLLACGIWVYLALGSAHVR